MNKAALKRLLDAIDHDDLDGVRRALAQGAAPTDQVEGLPIPAFYLTTRKEPLRHAQAMLDLFLEQGMDPNLRFAGRFGRPLRIHLGTPLLLSVLSGAPSAEPGEPLVQRLLDAGADPLLETSNAPFHNAWHRAAERQRLEALDLLDRVTPGDWAVPSDRIHPVELAFERQRFRDQDEDRADVVADRLLQRFPRALDHRYAGATVLMRLQRGGRGCLPGVVWALNHGAPTTDVWGQDRSTYLDPEQHPVLDAGRPFSVWPSLVRLARSQGVTHPLVQRAWQDPVLMGELNRPVWHHDVQEYGSDDRWSTPLSLALHEEVHHLAPDERAHWEALIDRLVAHGAVPNLTIDPSCPTPGQTWAAADDTGHTAVLDRYPAWEAPHPVSGRTPLFEALTPETVEACLARGQRLDHVDAAGEQAFATLMARGITDERSTLATWCASRMEQGQAPLDGVAQGRTVRDWAGARADLLKALNRASGQHPTAPAVPAGALALHAAADGKRLGVMRSLLAKGADVNVQDPDGLTPVMHVLMAPVTTLNQVIKRMEMIELLAQAGARGDAVGTATFDAMPDRARTGPQGREPGAMVTTTGSALHLAGVLAIDGQASISARQRFTMVQALLNLPGATEPAAWSDRCSELVAQVLLSAQEPHESDAHNRPPALSATWDALGLDRLNPAQRDDLFMALLDPRRALSQEGRNTGFLSELSRRFGQHPTLIDSRVQWLIDHGAHPFAVDLAGRSLREAMQEWVEGVHPPVRLQSRSTELPVKVATAFQQPILNVWKRWVDVAVETRALQDTWSQACDQAPAPTASTVRRRL